MSNKELVDKLTYDEVYKYLLSRKFHEVMLKQCTEPILRVTATAEYDIDDNYGRSHEELK
jgi:hypothetical protein